MAVFAAAMLAIAGAQAGRGPDEPSVVLDLRAQSHGSDRVILTLGRQAPVRLSLAAADEEALFGIKVAHHKPEVERTALAPTQAIAPEAPIVQPELRPAPRRERWTRTRAGERRTIRTRKWKRARAYAKARVPVVPVAAPSTPALAANIAATTPAAPQAPARTPGKAIALSDDYRPVEEGEPLGFKLGNRTSLRLGSLSSMVPTHADDDDARDFKHPSRSRDEDEASERKGAAVGLTFDLN